MIKEGKRIEEKCLSEKLTRISTNDSLIVYIIAHYFLIFFSYSLIFFRSSMWIFLNRICFACSDQQTLQNTLHSSRLSSIVFLYTDWLVRCKSTNLARENFNHVTLDRDWLRVRIYVFNRTKHHLCITYFLCCFPLQAEFASG